MIYTQLDPRSIKPQGWIKRQLEIQADGLSGNLHKIWPDIRDSAWIGGSREDWERVPYWLDGFIPLAFLLNDSERIKTAENYINAIIMRQAEDGWICPCTDEQRAAYDIWAYFLICKVLALYCDFTGSISAGHSLRKALKCLYTMLKKDRIHLFSWGKSRWFECLIPIMHVYKTEKEPWLVELAVILKDQGTDWSTLSERFVRPLNVWTQETHIVNIAMMLKYEALYCELTGDSYTDIAGKLWQCLYRYNGNAAGAFNGDECLAGLAPNRGFELCSVVELMYSMEILYSVTGDPVWAQRLEKLAFNALPATLSDDMRAHQYDQSVNQIACFCHPGKPFYGTNSADANRFGLEPNFGCCTANFSQGWPKLVMNTYLKTDNGICAALLLPVRLDTVINGVGVHIDAKSQYPFRNACKYTVTTDAPVKFEFKIRIPSFAVELRVNGVAADNTGYVIVNREWNTDTEITLEFSAAAHLTDCPYNLKAVEYGSLLFALPLKPVITPVEYTKDGVDRKFPYCDYDYMPKDEWRYAFASDDFAVNNTEISDIPFSSEKPPLTVTAELCRIDWEFAEGYENICERCPESARPLSKPEKMRLVPYGCAKLRMTALPLAKKEGEA